MVIRVVEILGLTLAVAGAAVLFLGRRSKPQEPANATRRMFLNRALLGGLGVFAVGFGGGTLGFVWPNVLAGFGKMVRVGKFKDVAARINATRIPYYNAEGRFYLVPYDTSDRDNRYVKAGVAKDGLMALYQKCAHLGCRVPFCEQSQWFECPCHQSKYNLAGEKTYGPAPAGLSRYPMEIDADGTLYVDTSEAKAEPPLGTDTLHAPPAGPFCVSIPKDE